MRENVRLFKALSDVNRIRILKMLESRPLCVCEITEVLNLAASTVSKHLSILRDCGFVADEKDGKWVQYKIAPDSAGQNAKDLLSLVRNWFSDDNIIHNDRQKVESTDKIKICNII